jgi:hypothetical protein
VNKTLERVSNVAVIVACAAFTAHYGFDFYRRQAVHRPTTAKAGDVLRDNTELGFKRARLTLLLVTRSGCHFCSESMPFYQRVVEASGAAGVRLVAATAEDVSANQAYLLEHGLRIESVVSTVKNEVQAPATPTLLLIRNDGRVVNSWVGKLSEAQEKEVLKTIQGGP